MEVEVTNALLAKYRALSEEALAMAKNAIVKEEANEVLDMAERYINDAKFFEEKGDFVRAYGALNYAHGWLDAGARLGLYNVKDDRLFTVDGE